MLSGMGIFLWVPNERSNTYTIYHKLLLICSIREKEQRQDYSHAPAKNIVVLIKTLGLKYRVTTCASKHLLV
jgi:hypothetical protein